MKKVKYALVYCTNLTDKMTFIGPFNTFADAEWYREALWVVENGHFKLEKCDIITLGTLNSNVLNEIKKRKKRFKEKEKIKAKNLALWSTRWKDKK